MPLIRVYPVDGSAPYDVSVASTYSGVNRACDCKYSERHTLLSFTWGWDRYADVEFTVDLSIHMDDAGWCKGLPVNPRVPRVLGTAAVDLAVEYSSLKDEVGFDVERFGYVDYDKLIHPLDLDNLLSLGIPPLIQAKDYVDLIMSMIVPNGNIAPAAKRARA